MIVRMFLNCSLQQGIKADLDSGQVNYLANVLRMKNGDKLAVFDGRSGEYEAVTENLSRKSGSLRIGRKIRDFSPSPDIWLLFAPLKKDCTDMVIQKATELGVAKIIPVITKYTNNANIRIERYAAQAIEAAEQCRRLDVPQIEKPQTLEVMLKNFPADRTLFFLNEKGSKQDILETIGNHTGKAALLIGPEGGFSEDEIKKILAYPKVCDIFLGNRILRAETAALAGLVCWQAVNGDWKD